MTTLDLPGLSTYLADHHRHDLLRVETLPRYRSGSDGTELTRFLRGDPEPDRAAKTAWLDRIRTDTTQGRLWRRLRVVAPPLTDYVRYSCEWGYTDNTAAGENVRILDLSDQPTADVLTRIGDFYLLDDHYLADMHYNADGAFHQAKLLDPPITAIHRAAATAGWHLGEPFTDWWARHPEHHRTLTLPR